MMKNIKREYKTTINSFFRKNGLTPLEKRNGPYNTCLFSSSIRFSTAAWIFAELLQFGWLLRKLERPDWIVCILYRLRTAQRRVKMTAIQIFIIFPPRRRLRCRAVECARSIQRIYRRLTGLSNGRAAPHDIKTIIGRIERSVHRTGGFLLMIYRIRNGNGSGLSQ